jgi:putative toxin-antitoxin system antitoxin component (TIGR02293 family)
LVEYIGQWLGTQPGSEYELALLAERGLPLSAIAKLLAKGLTRSEVFRIVIPERTLKHRKARRERLNREESDRAIRTARLLARAGAVFGGDQRALEWMRQPKRRFKRRSPLELMTTETGGRLVEEMLIQTDEGMFA